MTLVTGDVGFGDYAVSGDIVCVALPTKGRLLRQAHRYS